MRLPPVSHESAFSHFAYGDAAMWLKCVRYGTLNMQYLRTILQWAWPLQDIMQRAPLVAFKVTRRGHIPNEYPQYTSLWHNSIFGLQINFSGDVGLSETFVQGISVWEALMQSIKVSYCRSCAVLQWTPTPSPETEWLKTSKLLFPNTNRN